MRRISFLFLLFISFLADAQTKISEMTTYLGNGDSAWVPVVVGNSNRKMYGRDLSKALTTALQSAINGKQNTIGDTLSIGGFLLYKNANNRLSIDANIEATTLRTSGIANIVDANNAQVNPTTIGTLIYRSVADDNAALRVNQGNNSSTGAIFKGQFGGVDKFVIDKDGNIAIGLIAYSSITGTSNVAVKNADNSFSSDQTVTGIVTSTGSASGFAFNRREAPAQLGGVLYSDGAKVSLFSNFYGNNVMEWSYGSLRFPSYGAGFAKFDASGNVTSDNTSYTVANSSITGATKTKITYDSKGLVTAGANAAVADITGLQDSLATRQYRLTVDSLQASLRYGNHGWLSAIQNNSTTLAGIAMGASGTGTATARTVATGSYFGQCSRVGYVSTTSTTNSTCGIRNGASVFYRGDAANRGGFEWMLTWGVSSASTIAGLKGFVGFTGGASALAGTTEPSALTNVLGFGWSGSATTMNFYYNDASGSADSIALGANYPTNTISTDMYETYILCYPNSSSVYYKILNKTTGNSVDGTVSTNIPGTTTLLGYHAWLSSGNTASTPAIDIVSGYQRPLFR